MQANQLFLTANFLAFAGWLGLILFPSKPITRKVILYGNILILALVYTGLFIWQRHIFNQGGGFSTLQQVKTLFANEYVLVAGWIHYLAFDLFVGLYIQRTAMRHAIPRLVTILCLLCTFMFGPAGLLLFLVVRGMYALPLYATIKKLTDYNRPLVFFGWLNLLLAAILLAYLPFNNTVVLGINSMIKPIKFALSSWIFACTMAYLLHYLDDQKQVKRYSKVAWIVLSFEIVAITIQAFRGRLSHFNTATVPESILFMLMGAAIMFLMFWTARIIYLFFRQKQFSIPMPMVWAIRLALVIFLVFSIEGGLMAQRLSHTVGAADGGKGIFFVNWSTAYGDLRIAHFFGIHALQCLPLFALLVSLSSLSLKSQTWLTISFATLYTGFVSLLFLRALAGLPSF